MSFLSRVAQLFRRSSSYYYQGSPPTIPRENIGESRAYQYSAYWCCVRVICETIAQIPWRIHEKTNTGQRIADLHPADRLLQRQPNPWQDPAVWRELMVRHCLTWGNAYSEIERDPSNKPIALWPIEPHRVTPQMIGGSLWYEVQQPDGAPPEYIPSADMLHFRGLGDELAGWSVLTYAANTLGLALTQDESMYAQMRNGARLSGILSPPGGGSLPKEKHDRVKKEWEASHTGSKNHGKVYLLSQGLEYKTLSMPNTDAQLLDSRKLSVLDICRFMRVPPHMAYDLERATFSNIEHQSIEFRVHTIGPWTIKFEQQVNRKLISIPAQRTYYSKMNVKALLRADLKTQAEYYQKLRDLGALSPNEIRKLEDLDDLGPDGDVYLVPVNMQTLERVGQEPEPQPVPLIPEGENQNGNNRLRRH